LKTNTQIPSKLATIRKLTDYVLLNSDSVNSFVLYNGKAGMALALFESTKYLHDENVEDKAFRLLQESLVIEKKTIVLKMVIRNWLCATFFCMQIT